MAVGLEWRMGSLLGPETQARVHGLVSEVGESGDVPCRGYLASSGHGLGQVLSGAVCALGTELVGFAQLRLRAVSSRKSAPSWFGPVQF